MAGLLDEEEKSWVGQAFDGLLNSFLAPTEKRETKEEYDARMFELFGDPKENLYSVIDKSVEGLRTLGVSDELIDGRPTTTEDNFYKSLDNTIYNLPSQVPGLLKAGVDVITDPVEAGKGLLEILEGASTNLGDVVFDTLLPEKYEQAFKDRRNNNATEQSLENEANASAMGNAVVTMLSTKQGRREAFQQHGLDGLIALSAIPKSILKLSKAQQQQVLAAFMEGFDPERTINNLTKNISISGQGIMSDMKSQIMGGEIGASRLGQIDMLAKAKQLHKDGVDAKTIWNETGFGLAQDGKWRFEIDDSQSSLNKLDLVLDDKLKITGDELIKHEELMKAYPELANLDVYPMDYNMKPNEFGYYAEVNGEPRIGLNPMAQMSLEERSLGKSEIANIKKGRTLHEIQHAIQAIEGHAKGSSQRVEAEAVFAELYVDTRKQIDDIDLQLTDSSADLAKRKLLLGEKTALERGLVDAEKMASDAGFYNYKNRVLGETEAFSTQADVAMTMEERISRGLPYYLTDKDAIIRGGDSASGVDKGLLSDLAPQSLVKSTEFKRRNDGTYVGFSPTFDTPQKLNKLITQLDKLAVEGKDARMWYEDSSNQILNLVNGDVVEAEKIAQILAITSQGATVKTNTNWAFKAYSQYKAGQPIEAGRFPAAQGKKIEAILNGGSWEGRKTNSFYRNLMVEIDPTKLAGTETTQDMWMARAFGLDSEVPGGAQYEIMERITQSIANKHDYKPHQAQAAIWVAVKARNDAMKSVINGTVKKKGWGNNANDIFPQFQKKFDNYFRETVYGAEFNVDEFLKASYSFSDGINDNLGYINLEAVPGTTTDLLPGIRNADPVDIAAYTKDMYSIFLDENGVDMLAKEIGIVSPGNFLGFGGWKGDINPNVQVQGILSGTQAGGINAADIELVETYAAVVGTLFKQDGVSYRRAFAEKAVGKQNAVKVDIGRTLDKDESVRLYAELQKQFKNDKIEPTSATYGAQVINYTQFDDVTISNADFKKLVKQAIIDADLGDVDIGYYNSKGKLLENDWRESLNGESYKNRENSTSNGRDVYERMVNKYQGKVDKENARYKKDYGW